MGALEQTPTTDLATADTTSAAVSNDPNLAAGPATAQGGVNAARKASDSTASATANEEEATSEEQEAYDQAMQAADTVLYENDQTADAVANMLTPEDKINGAVEASIMTLTQIDKQIDMPEEIIAQVAMDITDMIVDIAEEGKGMQYSEQEAQAVWGSVWEGVMENYGVDEEEYNAFTSDMSDEEVEAQTQAHKGFLGE